MPAPSLSNFPVRPLPIRLLGTGACRPPGTVTGVELDARLGLASGTSERRHGVARRSVAGPGERATELGARAARSALTAAGLASTDLDAVVSAASVPEQAIPCQAALLQRALGLGDAGIAALDVNASCLSFVAALDLLAPAIATGRFDTVLVVSSELPSVGVDETDAATGGLFGDGAAAVVLGRAGPVRGAGRGGPRGAPSALLATSLATWADHADCCRLPGGGTGNRVGRGLDEYLAATRFAMDGPALYRAVGRRIRPFVDALLERAGVTLAELDLVVPHQASARALAGLVRHLGIDPARVVDILADHGNQVAASLPTALHRAIASGRLRRGDTVALLGTGAGVSLGGAVLRY